MDKIGQVYLSKESSKSLLRRFSPVFIAGLHFRPDYNHRR